MAEESKWRQRGKALRAEGLAFAIPTVLVAFPLIGALLGRWIGQRYGVTWPMYVGLIGGAVCGVRECIRLVKEISKATK